jgi:large subunit ribosomal protein L21
MYAVFENGSHQYRVSEGEMVRLDYRDGAEPGQEVVFDQVLLVQSNAGTKIGRPYLDGCKVIGEVVEHNSDKITVWKFKRRKRYRRKKGHRQHYTAVKINQIVE